MQAEIEKFLATMRSHEARPVELDARVAEIDPSALEKLDTSGTHPLPAESLRAIDAALVEGRGELMEACSLVGFHQHRFHALMADVRQYLPENPPKRRRKKDHPQPLMVQGAFVLDARPILEPGEAGKIKVELTAQIARPPEGYPQEGATMDTGEVKTLLEVEPGRPYLLAFGNAGSGEKARRRVLVLTVRRAQ